jgi:catechol 2,3-dioxygenase-like lactoylglutathione lyase family enzyme
MLSHVLFGSNDLPRATTFYDAVLGLIGARQLMKFGTTIVWGTTAPALAICTPYDGAPATHGNGTMVALNAPTRELVDQMHAKALDMGGTDEGAPGLRGNEANGFYAAYFRDPDGNKLCVFRAGPA